jgi:hypothetical protein
VRENIKQRHQNVDGEIEATAQELQKLAGEAQGCLQAAVPHVGLSLWEDQHNQQQQKHGHRC